MGVFNFMESFFFISLGVTFILILLLVYHFKQRLSMVENKADTMVDIMNNMVKEMGIIKNLATSQLPRNFQQQPQHQQFQQLQVPITYLDVVQDKNRIVVSENDEDSQEESESEDEESDDEDDEESESESESDDENDDKEEEEDKNKDDKLIPVDNIDVEVILSDIITEIDNSIKTETETETEPEPESESMIEPEIESQNISEPGTESVIESEDYTKMSITQLRSLVVAKSFISDASKMKKKHILDLLTTSK